MEKKMRYYTAIIAAAVVAAFMAQASISGFTDAFLLNSSEAINRPWILITSVFLHGSASHLIFNMFALFLFGLLLEKFVGSNRFLLVFFLSGAAASVASVFFYPSSLGASGAVYGVIGALAAIRPKMVVWAYGVPMPMVAAAGFYLLLDLAGLFYPSSIANAAHIAGLIVGGVMGLFLREPQVKDREEKRKKVVSDSELDSWEKEWLE